MKRIPVWESFHVMVFNIDGQVCRRIACNSRTMACDLIYTLRMTLPKETKVEASEFVITVPVIGQLPSSDGIPTVAASAEYKLDFTYHD